MEEFVQIAEHVYQVADDIYLVQLPLPFALSSVNCYLLRADDGWTILDSGLNMSRGRAGWQAAFAALQITPCDIRQVLLSHFHPDHVGMAGWLQALGRDNGCEPAVWISPRDADMVGRIWGLPEGVPEPTTIFFRAWGVPDDLLQVMAEGMVHLRAMTHPLPRLTLLDPGSTLRIGKRRFVVLHTPGHSDGHLVFYDADDRLLLCGDHVLMKITPHIGTWPESEPLVLERYLASLRELQALDVRLALTGHGVPVTDWSGRLVELEQHHAVRLQDMATATGDGATAFEVCTQVFDSTRLSPHELRFAMAETISHLDVLVRQGRLYREDRSGVPVYRLADAG